MKQYDVAIIGGGIHGAGVLQAAAAAGHSALLIERLGLASGTSSRSSKLIHGGLRYLETGQFTLVRENLRERAIHLRIAPSENPSRASSASMAANSRAGALPPPMSCNASAPPCRLAPGSQQRIN